MQPWDVSFLPNACSQCGAPWDDRDYGFSARQRIVDLVCVAGHEVRFDLSLEELLEFERLVVPWTGGKPTRYVGGPLDGRVNMFPEPGPNATIRTESGERYVFLREDSDTFVYEHVGASTTDARSPRRRRFLRRNAPEHG